MKKYRLFCDSNCELWHTTVKELGLDVIYMPYTMGDGKELYYDMGEKFDYKDFYAKMRAGAVPKTSALNEYDYISYFEPILQNGEDIYYITFSRAMSATFSALESAIATLKEKYPERQIRTKDTKAITMASGIIVYYGALKWQEGASMDELDAYLDELIPHFTTYFAVDSLVYFRRSGRVSNLTSFFGTMLNIKPLLYFSPEGTILTIGKAKGMQKALSAIMEYMRTKSSELDKYKTFVLHADCEELANTLANNVRESYPQAEVCVQQIGPVVGSHCGPGTIAVLFHATEK